MSNASKVTKVVLFSHDNRGKAVGVAGAPDNRVKFDDKGYATVEADEKTLERFRALGWLLEQSVPDTAPVLPPPTPMPPADESDDPDVTQDEKPSKARRGR